MTVREENPVFGVESSEKRDRGDNSCLSPTGLKKWSDTLYETCYTIWGSNFPAMKLGLSEIAPFTFRTISNAIAAIGRGAEASQGQPFALDISDG